MKEWMRIAAGLVDVMYLASFGLVLVHSPWWAYLSLLGLLLGARVLVRVLRSETLQASRIVYPLTVLTPFLFTLDLARTEKGQPSTTSLVVVGEEGARDTEKKVVAVVALALLVGVSATNLVGQHVLSPVMAPADERAEDYLRTTLLSITISYGTVRALDRLVSVATETNMTLGFAGTGMSFKPGMRLKPLQDVLERGGEVLFWALGAVAFLIVVTEVIPMVSVPFLLSASAGLAFLALILPPPVSLRMLGLAKLALALFVVTRLLIPLALVLASLMAESMLEDRRLAAQADAEQSVEALEEMESEAAQEEDEPGLIARTRATWDVASDLITNTVEFADRMISSTIQLIVIFLLQSVVIPIGMILLLWKGWGILAGDQNVQAVVAGAGEGVREIAAARARLLSEEDQRSLSTEEPPGSDAKRDDRRNTDDTG